MSLRSALMRIDLEQLLELADLPEELVVPQDRHDATGRIAAFASFLQSKVTWESVVQDALAREDLRAAIRLMERCRDSGGTLRNPQCGQLDEAWTTWVRAIRERRHIAITRLEAVPTEAPQASTEAQGLTELLQIIDVGERPASVRVFDELHELNRFLDDLLNKQPKSEIDALMELAALEISQDWDELLETSVIVWRKLLHGATRDGSQMGARRLLNALPQLVLERQLDKLKELSEDGADFDAIDVPVGVAAESVLPLRAVRVAPGSNSGPRASGEFRRLRQFSEAVVHAAPEDGRAIGGPNDLADHERLANREPTYISAARVWLRAAKASAGDWQKRALGRGLLAEGRARMQDDSLLQAWPLLLDALELLGGYEPDIDVFRTAVKLTLSARVWPHHRARVGPDHSHSVREWARDPSLPFARGNVLPADLIDRAASIWADDLEDDAIGERFLGCVGSELGDDVTLYRRCLEHLLTPARLRRNPRRVCERLRWLLREAHPSADLDTMLDQLTQDLGEFDAGERTTSTGKRILELVPNLVANLSGLPTHTVAPVMAVRETLPAVIEHLVGTRDRLSELPQLSVAPVCRTFYPEERSGDLLLPIMLRNDDRAGRAKNIQVSVRVDPKHGQPPPVRLVEARSTSPDLDAGDEQELIMVFDVDPDIQERVGEVRLIPEVRTDQVLHKARSFSIEFRPSGLRSRRKSPFTTGIAVGGERFVGRERELERLVDWILSDVGRVPVVVGIRRIGKTSLVRKAMADPEVGRHFYSTYWDVEARPDSDSAADFLFDLASTIRDAIPERYHERLRFIRQPLRERPYQAFDDFVQSIEAAQLPKRILVVIDECDRLLKLVDDSRGRQDREGRPLSPQEAFQPEVFGALRKALMTTERLRLVLAGLPALVRQAGYENRLFGLMSPIQLRAFTTEEASEVMDAAKPFMEFSAPARNAAFRATGLQPYLLQVMCDCLFHRMKDQGRDVVAPIDVQRVIEEQLLPNESNLADYISLIDGDWELLFGLAEALASAPQSRRYVSVYEVGQALRNHGLEWSEYELREALNRLVPSVGDDLVERPLVERAPNDRNRFRLVVGIVGEYLRESGPYR